jgi:ubiquinol-cytochrome c reductase cytochrome b subunit
VTNFGQMYSYHVFVLPLAVVALVIVHVLLVRRHGIVPPFELSGRGEPAAREPVRVPESDSVPAGGGGS